jgi:hypothetical protein
MQICNKIQFVSMGRVRCLALFLAFSFLQLHSLTCAASTHSKVAPLAPGTALPIRFTHTVMARTARTGDALTARTLQVVMNGPVDSVPKGARVLGHVVQVSYGGKNLDSLLTIEFDKIVYDHASHPICASARAIANSLDAYQATMETTSLETDPTLGTTLVGGDHIRPGDNQVIAPDGDDVGISNHFGIFSRLEPGDPHRGSALHACGGIPTLQSVAIFSSRACGLYGFPGMTMLSTGNGDPRGQIQLQSHRSGVEIPSGSAALLQIVSCGSSK